MSTFILILFIGGHSVFEIGRYPSLQACQDAAGLISLRQNDGEWKSINLTFACIEKK